MVVLLHMHIEGKNTHSFISRSVIGFRAAAYR